MSTSNGLKFVETIKPSWANAFVVQCLTLQDVIAGGFPNPRDMADPQNYVKVFDQMLKMLRHPERYAGYTLDGDLVAYIKLMPSPSAGSEPADEWAIMGLVASDKLDANRRESALVGLLQHAIMDRRSGKSRTVTVPIHKHDPLLEIALNKGFMPVGVPAEQDGAPGLDQQVYRRIATH